MKRKVIEAWMGFIDDRPHVYTQDDDGNQMLDLFIKKKEAKRAYEDVRKVRIEWVQEA